MADDIGKILYDKKSTLSSAHNVSNNELIILDIGTKINTSAGVASAVRRLSIKNLPFSPDTSQERHFPPNIKTIVDALEYLMARSGTEGTEICPSAMLSIKRREIPEANTPSTIQFNDMSLHYTSYDSPSIDQGLLAHDRLVIDPLATDLPEDTLYTARVTLSAFISNAGTTSEEAVATFALHSALLGSGSDTYRTPELRFGTATTPVSLDVLFVNITRRTDLGIWVDYTSTKALWAPKLYLSVTYIPQKKIIDILPPNVLVSEEQGSEYALYSSTEEQEGFLVSSE